MCYGKLLFIKTKKISVLKICEVIKMTNYERVKQMSKIELASFLMRTKFSKDSNNDCIFSSKMCNKREIPNNCILCMNTWLKKRDNRDDVNEKFEGEVGDNG